MNYQQIIKKLKSMADPQNVEGMARFGINTKNTLGISVYDIRKIAAKMPKDHRLAKKLWSSGIHEARILACFIDEPAKVTRRQMESWASDFDSWDVCDLACGFLFDKTSFAYQQAVKWSGSKKEFVKRAAFALIAALSVHDKQANDSTFIRLLPLIKRQATDERNYVRKAVNWALRSIGKRNWRLNKSALRTAKAIQGLDSKAAKWIAADAIRELKSNKVQQRLGRQR